ncbi:TadE/TadG family type IV pilus assembly protein [Bordetella sp. N]|uniref:TadE/TadG family type IV pilus assembly protein n=1 Tax=Bordetella sp. N TaxID=1746199 RepID=UPI00070F5683|nr:TadE family protein [Bordetella sp. N]ALM84002.1 hypothetical protein ASB57_14380 [Bordetella sp. N]
MFSVFFVLLYGVVTYGFIFMAQQSINLAADQGVRTALRWQQGQGALQARATAAWTIADQNVRWLGAMGAATPGVAVCGPSGVLAATGGATCSGRPLDADQFEVIVTYAYGAHPLIPTLPGMGLAVPAALSARSTAKLGNGMVIAQGSG